MAFAWGDAAGAMVDERRAQRKEATDLEGQLAEIAYRQALIRQSESQEQRLREQMDMQRQQFDWTKQQQEQTASDKRNAQGLQMMAGDVADQYPGEPQKLVGSLIRAGMQPPAAMMAPPGSTAPEQFTLGPGQLRFDSTGKEVARGNEPIGAATSGFTLGRGQVRYDEQGNEVARGEPFPAPASGGVSVTGGTPAESTSQAFLLETANRTISAIDGVLPDINRWTAGAVGSVLSNIPGTPAANVNAELAAVASNVAFNALQQMRAASKTGGALGQVSERELDLLSSVEGSIRQNQSPANLKAQLQKVRESMVRVQQAAGGGAAPARAGVGIKAIREIK